MKEVFANVFLNAYSSFSFMLLLYSLLAAVALLVIMRQTGLLRREKRWRRIFVCLYYLYIPVVFVLSGGAWSTVRSVENVMLGVIEDTKPTLSNLSTSYASAAWETMAATFQKDSSASLKDMSLTIADHYANKLMEDVFPDKVSMLAQPAVDRLKDMTASAIATTVTDMAVKEASNATGIHQNLLRSFWTTSFTAALQDGLISDIIKQQVGRAMAPFYAKIKLILALLMLPIILETSLALYSRRKAAA